MTPKITLFYGNNKARCPFFPFLSKICLVQGEKQAIGSYFRLIGSYFYPVGNKRRSGPWFQRAGRERRFAKKARGGNGGEGIFRVDRRVLRYTGTQRRDDNSLV